MQATFENPAAGGELEVSNVKRDAGQKKIHCKFALVNKDTEIFEIQEDLGSVDDSARI